MKLILVMKFFFIIIVFKVNGQNIIPNNSFEEIDSCPNGNYYANSIVYLKNWIGQGSGLSPDCYNTCVSTGLSIPSNWIGYQFPLTGNGYAGICVYDASLFSSLNLREFIQVQLSTPLIVGNKYYYSYKVSRADGAQYASNIGMFFSTNKRLFDNPLPNFSQIQSDSMITDSANWTEVKGQFISDSSYSFVTVGNFYDNINSSHILVNSVAPWQYGYYYIDDVCISLNPLICYTISTNGNDDNYCSNKLRINPTLLSST